MRLFRPVFVTLILCALLVPCFAADGSGNDNIFTITVAGPTLPKDVQVRYFLGGDFGSISGSSTATGAGDKIVIKTVHESQPAKSFKAIVYSPGCQFATISVDDLSTGSRTGEFKCQKLPTTLLQGRVPLTGNLVGKEYQVEILYACDWAQQFFSLGPGAISPFFLAKVPVATDGAFSIELPDFAGDPLWSSFSKNASLNFYLVDSSTGQRVNELIPPASVSEGNGMKVASGYQGEMLFTVKGSS